MTRRDLENVIFQNYVVEQSVAWLKGKISEVQAEIDLVESTPPIDFDRLGKLESELKLLYRRGKIEEEINEKLALKFKILTEKNVNPSGTNKVGV